MIQLAGTLKLKRTRAIRFYENGTELLKVLSFELIKILGSLRFCDVIY